MRLGSCVQRLAFLGLCLDRLLQSPISEGYAMRVRCSPVSFLWMWPFFLSSPSCGSNSSGQNCNALAQDLGNAADAFSPHNSPNACSQASDCVFFNYSISRNGQDCAIGCSQLYDRAYAAELSAFLENDPGVTTACEAFIEGRCLAVSPPCPEGPVFFDGSECFAAIQCASGVCGSSGIVCQ